MSVMLDSKRSSTSLPLAKWKMLIPVVVSALPVGATPSYSPEWVPRQVQRAPAVKTYIIFREVKSMQYLGKKIGRWYRCRHAAHTVE